MNLWENDQLRLPPDFWSIYKDCLDKRNLLESAISGNPSHGIYGGVTKEETENHFTHRFPNSGSRIEVSLLDPKKDLGGIPTELQTTFTTGKVKILDAPCGTGAGSLTLLTTLHVLRSQGLSPSGNLDVEILAADISRHALLIYEEIMTQLAPLLERSGIRLTWITKEWNAQKVPETSSFCDNWLVSNDPGVEYFVLIANISGVKKSGYEKNFKESIDHIAARISNFPSTLLWVEPPNNSAFEFITKIVNGLATGLKWLFNKHENKIHKTEFNWWHQIQKKEISGGASVIRYERKPDV